MIERFPIVFAILDGWGIAPASDGNPVTLANTPVMRRWAATYPHTAVFASGPAVGLDVDQDGNSEAGHMNIGAGRMVPQDDMRVSQSITDGTFFRNPAFMSAIHHAEKHGATLHIIGMLGNTQSAHSNPDHLTALLLLVQRHKGLRVRLHLFTDGRDSPRYYAREIVARIMPFIGEAKIATVMGRYYGMDRNKTWSRTEQAYEAIVNGKGQHHVPDPMMAITQAYNRGESDEFITTTVVGDYQGMSDHDAIIHFNLRSDRARQLTKSLTQSDFERKNAATKCFQRSRVITDLLFTAMTDFGPDLPGILTAYPAIQLRNTLPFVMADRRQLYIAESEKYAHVTYFFNGGYADPVAGEKRVMIPSPDVPFYDATPLMSSDRVTTTAIQALNDGTADFVVMNYANLDMVAHTGNLKASVQALELTDALLGQLEAAVLAKNGLLVVSADHGNVEELLNLKTKEVDTEHSTNPVPFYVISRRWPTLRFRTGGILGDIAPTILALAGEAIPPEMTGHSLIVS